MQVLLSRARGYLQTGPHPGSRRLEILADEPEHDAVDPLLVPPVGLSLDAFLDEPRPFEMADRAVVEPVALELNAVEVEIEDQVLCHELGRLRSEAAAPEVGVEHDP